MNTLSLPAAHPGDGLRSRLRLPRYSCRQETLILAVSLWFTLACNGPFWHALLQARPLSSPGAWSLALGLGLSITALHALIPGLLGNRYTLKPLLALLLTLACCASFYMAKFGIYVDPDMLRNVLRTDPAEAKELLTWDLLPHLILYLLLPLVLLQRVQLRPVSRGRGLLIRGAGLLVALILGAGGLALNFQDLAALMRNNKEMRYLITPGNSLYSLGRVLGKDARAETGPKRMTGPDAALGAAWSQRQKPVLFVIVVGETARAANWGQHPGLDGAPRNSTPELSSRGDLIQFAEVTSCGTNTEVSVPCMFSAQGRRHYDEDAIRNSESLLHVLDRAGFKVVWRDNQAGCKGTCSGLEQERLHNAQLPGLCDGERCLDEILLEGAEQLAADAQGNLVLVLHQLGNHGPAYYKRYPERFRRFTPTCDTADLSQCSQEAIANSYDNALLYTDHFLARTQDFLKARAERYDTALIYLSDHGESLGENGLYLHGMPYAIAPREQTRVPMLMWLSPGYARSFGLDTACLRREAGKPASHDNLFHTVLGLLDVSTQARDPQLDISAPCHS